MIPTFGILSYVINSITGGQFILMDSKAGAVAGIVFADAWMWSPFVMLLVLAGLVSVPKYLYEAAAIDRVSAWRRFWSITFPYIRGLLMLALLFRTIEAFKLADLVILLTKGGNDTMTISYHLIRIANEQNKTSEGAAISYIMLFMVIVLTNLYLYLANPQEPGRPEPWQTEFPSGNGSAFAGAGGVAEAGWGRTLVVAIVSLIYFLPVLFIIFTAIKPQALALSVPPTLVADLALRPHPRPVCLHPDAGEFRLGVFPRHDGGRPAGSHRLRPLLLQLDRDRVGLRPACPRHRHAGRLWLLALSAEGQRHLSLHHPDDPHAAGDRRHHPGDPDVPRRGPFRLLSRHHHALHGLQSRLHHLDDEELLR